MFLKVKTLTDIEVGNKKNCFNQEIKKSVTFEF